MSHDESLIRTANERRNERLESQVVKHDELSILRRRVKAQRKELRRLNKELSDPKAAYWFGFRKGLDVGSETELRGKMNKVFGYKAVWEAEHGIPYPKSTT